MEYAQFLRNVTGQRDHKSAKTIENDSPVINQIVDTNQNPELPKNALSTIEVTYTAPIDKEKEKQEVKIQEKIESSQKTFKNWQDSTSEVPLLTKDEYKIELSNLAVRLETLSGSLESITWAREGNSDFYFSIESGEYEGNYLKLEKSLILGKSKNGKLKKGHLLFSKDPLIEKEHAKIVVENDGVRITDNATKSGTWLALVYGVDEEIEPDVVYKSSELNDFRFSHYHECSSIEGLLEYYNKLEYIGYFYELGFREIRSLYKINRDRFEAGFDSLALGKEFVREVVDLYDTVKIEFGDNPLLYMINLRVLEGPHEGVEIVSNFTGNRVGLIESPGEARDRLAFSGGVQDDIFDEELLRISYIKGGYTLRNISPKGNIFRRFAPDRPTKIRPGHRVCVGQNILYLFKYLNFAVGNESCCLISENSLISERVRISFYGVIQAVGETNDCQEFVYHNIIDYLKMNAKSLKLDDSNDFYGTFGNVIIKTFDDLDINFLKKYPKTRGNSGAEVNILMMIGHRLYSINLGSLRIHLIRGSKISALNFIHTMVNI